MTSVRSQRSESSISFWICALLAFRNGAPSRQSKPTLVAIRTFCRCPLSADALPTISLRMAEAIDRCRIDDGYIAIDGVPDCPDRFLIVASAPHPSGNRPYSKRDARGSKVSAGNGRRFERDIWHCSILVKLSRSGIAAVLLPPDSSAREEKLGLRQHHS